MNATPNKSPMNSGQSWGGIAVVLLATFTAFIQAYQAFAGGDARQDERLARIERLLCTTEDAARMRECQIAGLVK